MEAAVCMVAGACGDWLAPKFIAQRSLAGFAAQPGNQGSKLIEKAITDRRRDIFDRLCHCECDEWYMPDSVSCFSLEWMCYQVDRSG